MKVAHRQALWARMQSQTLCLIDSLKLGRQKIHCLEMDASVICTLHSFMVTALCQIDHMKATSLPNPTGTHTLRPIKLVVSWEVTLPFVYHPSHAMDLIDDQISTRFCAIVKDVVIFDPLPPIQIPLSVASLE